MPKHNDRSYNSMLENWLADALSMLGGAASVVNACRTVWQRHEKELRGMDDAFFTWQYDIRWAAHRLRRSGVMKPASKSPVGIWELED